MTNKTSKLEQILLAQAIVGREPAVQGYRWEVINDSLEVLNTQQGERVVFLGDNGTDMDQLRSHKYLLPDVYYTVSKLDVGSWRTTVYLKEIPGKGFNSVLFGNVVKYGKES